MKQFAIGDGNKKLTCADRYFADRETDDTMVIWDSDHADMPIRVSVITVGSKDGARQGLAYTGVIEKAAGKGAQAEIVGDKAVYSYQESSEEEADAINAFHEVGLGNHFCLFTLTLPLEKAGSLAHLQIQADLEEMIASLVERGDDEQFTCNLLVSEYDRIEAAIQSLLNGSSDDEAWTSLQTHLDQAYSESDAHSARQVGLAFGEQLRTQIPSLTWSAKIDGYGSALALDLGDSGICVFPEDMILKRFDKREVICIKDLADRTIEALEDMFRRNAH